jgi:hypothetical protein
MYNVSEKMFTFLYIIIQKNVNITIKNQTLFKKKNIIEYVLNIIVVIYQKNDLTKKQSRGGPRSSSLAMQGQRMAERCAPGLAMRFLCA